jgi:hypothetical protein
VTRARQVLRDALVERATADGVAKGGVSWWEDTRAEHGVAAQLAACGLASLAAPATAVAEASDDAEQPPMAWRDPGSHVYDVPEIRTRYRMRMHMWADSRHVSMRGLVR